MNRFRAWCHRRLRQAGRTAILPGADYCRIQAGRPSSPFDWDRDEYPVIGWVPLQVYERITGTAFINGICNYIRPDHAEQIERDPLFLTHAEFARYLREAIQ